MFSTETSHLRRMQGLGQNSVKAPRVQKCMTYHQKYAKKNYVHKYLFSMTIEKCQYRIILRLNKKTGTIDVSHSWNKRRDYAKNRMPKFTPLKV